MAARLARTKATVVTSRTEDGTRTEQELKGVSLVVRNNTATVRTGTEVVLEQPGVTKVAGTDSRHVWVLSFDDGSSWLVTDEKRRCCGQR